ncbi:MAG: hypothetical protein J6Z27_03385, partial [Bacteroidales bacterium]|nr:hypothetical protein [Bacteroidales bacterium]
MTDSRFDQIIREKLEGYQVEVGDGLWSGIEQKMAAAHRRKVAFRVSMISLAAAACLAVGLVLAVDRGDSKIALPAVAESVDITPEAPHEEVTAPVQEIKSVSARTAVAVNTPSRETPQPVAPEPVIVAEPVIS